MKRKSFKTLAIALALALPGQIFAGTAEETIEMTYLVVSQSDGTESSYALDTNPLVTFSKEALIVACNGDAVELAIKDVKDYHFTVKKVSTGINDLNADNPKTSEPSFSFQTAEFKGLKVGDRVAIYTINGQLVKQVIADESGVAGLGLRDLPKGAYILRTPNKSMKIVNN